jgi:pyruvate,water dikinase
MSFGIYDGCPGPGFWERDNSHFPLPMSRHLWELFLPAYDAGTRAGLARYGSIIDHFDFARIRGRLYLKTCFVNDPEEVRRREQSSRHALETRLWRCDRAQWIAIHQDFRRRLLELSKLDPAAMDPERLLAHIGKLRGIFREGTFQHFLQQPSSMFPVGDWVRQVCQWTGATPTEVLFLLKGSHTGAAGFSEGRWNAEEYADQIITGFDLLDLTLRELPHLNARHLPADHRHSAEGRSAEVAEFHRKLRERVPRDRWSEFDDGLAEARAAYGLHDDDVRTTYLWPLGLIRRAMLAAAADLVRRGRLDYSDHIFQTTLAEFDALISGAHAPTALQLSVRAAEFVSWKDEQPPPVFGEKAPAEFENLDSASARVNAAITFYLGEMEQRHGPDGAEPPWSLMVAGLPASPGQYEGWARVVRHPSDFQKLGKGDVLIAPTTSPAYNVILPMIGAVVTDRGGALCHCAIIAREFGIPAVVGTDQATSRIPDGARILVDGDRGFVVVRS